MKLGNNNIVGGYTGSAPWTKVMKGSVKVYEAGGGSQFYIKNETSGNNTFTIKMAKSRSLSNYYASNTSERTSLTGQYSLDGSAWTNINIALPVYDTTVNDNTILWSVTIPANGKLYLKDFNMCEYNLNYWTSGNSHTNANNAIRFGCTGNHSVGGLISTLSNAANSYFSYLFYTDTTLTDASALTIDTPVSYNKVLDTNNHNYSVSNDFAEYMFYGCTSLTTAPALPATTLAEYCYYGIFNGCTALTAAPALPATTMTVRCYFKMFSGCTSLTTAPALPATTLAEYCYSQMFYGCTALTAAPALPATTLARQCYSQMFYGCTSLTAAPTLPATTLADNCYNIMFKNCSSLNSITVNFTSWVSALDSTQNWVSGVSSSGTFTKPSALPETYGDSNIPSGWTVVNV